MTLYIAGFRVRPANGKTFTPVSIPGLAEAWRAVHDDDDLPGSPIPEGPEEPTTDPIEEDDPTVGHEPVVEEPA